MARQGIFKHGNSNRGYSDGIIAHSQIRATGRKRGFLSAKIHITIDQAQCGARWKGVGANILQHALVRQTEYSFRAAFPVTYENLEFAVQSTDCDTVLTRSPESVDLEGQTSSQMASWRNTVKIHGLLLRLVEISSDVEVAAIGRPPKWSGEAVRHVALQGLRDRFSGFAIWIWRAVCFLFRWGTCLALCDQ